MRSLRRQPVTRILAHGLPRLAPREAKTTEPGLARKCHDVRTCQLYAAMGNTDMAMQYLNQGYREHTEQLLRLQLNPAYDDMRTDPRFQELTHRIGLPQ